MPEILDHLTSEVGEALDVTVRDAVLDVTAPARVSVRTLTPHSITDRGERASVRVGDLVSDQAVRVVLQLSFPVGMLGSDVGVLLSVADQDGVMDADGGFESLGIAWRFASDTESDAQPRDVVVDRAVAELFASRARQDAVGLNRKGDWIGARASLEGVARKIKR
jgi:hypothetical protein